MLTILYESSENAANACRAERDHQSRPSSKAFRDQRTNDVGRHLREK